MTTWPGRLLAAAVLAAAALGGVTASVAAHEGEGTIEVVMAEPSGPLAVTYRVRLTFVADGHPAGDATVTAVAQRTGAGSTTPVTMTPGTDAGIYEGTVTFPDAGDWTVRFTAVTPPATLERTETVTSPPTTASPSTTAGSSATTGRSPTTATPPDTEEADDDGDGPPLAPFVVSGIIGVAVALILVSRRRR